LEVKEEIEDHQLVLILNVLKVAAMKDVQADLEVKEEIEDHQLVHIPNVLKVAAMKDVQADLEVKEEIEDHQLVVVDTKEEVALTEMKIATTAGRLVQLENLVVLIWLKELKLAI
jgi:hypothetical protein